MRVLAKLRFLMGSAPEAARDFLLPLPGIPTACGNGKWEVSQDLSELRSGRKMRTTGRPALAFHPFIGAILPSRPARSPCRRAQRRSRMARLRATASAARSVLDGREHDGMLDRVGAAISLCNKQTIKRRPRKTIKKRTHAHTEGAGFCAEPGTIRRKRERRLDSTG